VEDRDGRDTGRSWQDVIRKTARSVRFDAIWETYKRKQPELFQPDVDEPATRG
jgi:hypothetical protein